MSEDRTQPPSKRRRQQAREHGQVAHSPELTAAAGWLTAVALLGILGDDLTSGLTNLVHGSMTRPLVLIADRAAVVDQVRGLVAGLGWPLAVVLGGFAVGATAAHQLQVRGLCATALLAPSAHRLWAFSSGPGLAARGERLVWSIFKAVILVAAVAWSIGSGWGDVLKLGSLESPALARGAGQVLLGLGWTLAAVLLLLGLVDYGLRYRQFESMLRTTSEEQREDRRVIEGDPAIRSQRRRAARALRADSPDALVGASLVLKGTAGLTLVLGGGPPPRRVTVRTIVQGPAGVRLRRSAEAAKIAQIDAPALARRLARRPSAQSTLAAELIADLAAVWPTT
jgi:flagellar biosynthetic protein FlhB